MEKFLERSVYVYVYLGHYTQIYDIVHGLSYFHMTSSLTHIPLRTSLERGNFMYSLSPVFLGLVSESSKLIQLTIFHFDHFNNSIVLE